MTMPDTKLDDSLLEAFITNFYGYGNPQGKYWLIGMEERGGESFEEIQGRLSLWRERHCEEFEDVKSYLTALNIKKNLFNAGAKLQPTWRGLIRIMNYAEGQPCDVENLRRFQRESLGQSNSNNCLLELMPLPAPNIAQWPYKSWSELPYLKRRELYYECCIPIRKVNLLSRINDYKPRVVVFYGAKYQEHWAEIAQGPFEQYDALPKPIYWRQAGTTLYVAIDHPTAHGLTNHYFDGVGSFILDKLASSDKGNMS